MTTREDDLLADLTPAQREAVTHYEGPLLILAAAGSGKTRVITRRVAHLLEQGVRPGNILAITFTNKAAGEMRQRVEAVVPGCRVWVSTFHSFGARLLFVLIDEYQDTNHAQYVLARHLSVDHPNLCVVGDPDQCLPPGTLVRT